MIDDPYMQALADLLQEEDAAGSPWFWPESYRMRQALWLKKILTTEELQWLTIWLLRHPGIV